VAVLYPESTWHVLLFSPRQNLAGDAYHLQLFILSLHLHITHRRTSTAPVPAPVSYLRDTVYTYLENQPRSLRLIRPHILIRLRDIRIIQNIRRGRHCWARLRHVPPLAFDLNACLLPLSMISKGAWGCERVECWTCRAMVDKGKRGSHRDESLKKLGWRCAWQGPGSGAGACISGGLVRGWNVWLLGQWSEGNGGAGGF